MEILDTVIEGLIENKLKRTGRSRLPRTPRPLGTKALERRYFKAIRAIVKALRRLTTERIFPLLEPILQQAKVLRPDSKADAYVDDIEQALGRGQEAEAEHEGRSWRQGPEAGMLAQDGP